MSRKGGRYGKPGAGTGAAPFEKRNISYLDGAVCRGMKGSKKVDENQLFK